MPMIDGAMLFFLIGKVYNHRRTATDCAPAAARDRGGRRNARRNYLKEAGVRGLVAKPFVINRLIEKVKECLPGIESRRAAQATLWHHGAS